MNAGDGNLTTLIESIKTKGIDIIKTLIDINNQMFLIVNIYRCSKISHKCIYLTHNDIKPENMIFICNEDKYTIKFIDYGGFKFSETFFINIGEFTCDIMYYVYCIDYENYPIFTSPLYDIASTIYTMFCILSESSILNNDLNILIWELKILYVVNNDENNFVNIETKYNEIKKVLYDLIKYNNNDEYINKYINNLLIYLNLAMCIFRYHKINEVILNSNFINTNFEKFELLDLSLNMKPIKFIKFSDTLINYELLNAIIKTVKQKLIK